MDNCWFCGKKITTESFTCGNLKCLMIHDDMIADEINHRERLVRTGIWNSLWNWCGLHGDRLSLIQRAFYTVKLWICCLFGWHQHFGHDIDPIDAAPIYFRRTYGGWEESWLKIGPGLFTHWHYELAEDSEWHM